MGDEDAARSASGRSCSGGETRRAEGGGLSQFIEGVMADFLHRYAKRYPNVQVKLIEAIAWSDTLGMLKHRAIQIGQNLLHAVQPGDPRFETPLEVVNLLSASRAPLIVGNSGAIEIARLAAHPLLMLDTSFVSRRTFDATCRLAGAEANIVFESRTPHTVLAMAERGDGLAIVPSAVRIDRYGA